MNIDQKLFECHTTTGYSEAEWREILAHVVRKLERKLGHPIVTEDMKFYPDGLAGDIRIQESVAGRIEFSWFGRIGVTVLGNRECTWTEATLFLRGYGKRLIATDGSAYLSLIYEKCGDQYDWSDPRWMKDEYGEYEDWE